METRFSRTQRIYGAEVMRYLASCRVAVFGVGGVGGHVVEALARSGIGALDLIDNDCVCLSNINRQIIATEKTLGMYKVDAAEERVKDISPDCVVRTYKTFYLPDTQDQFDFRQYDYVVDAIDTVTGKLTIVENARKAGVPVISSMGAGNKVDPSAFEVADLYDTSVCPLAKVMRRECKKRGITSLKVVYSKEKPVCPQEDPETGAEEQAAEVPEDQRAGVPENQRAEIPEDQAAETPEDQRVEDPEKRGSARRRSVPGSTAFAPSVAGLIIAGEIINDLAAKCRVQVVP